MTQMPRIVQSPLSNRWYVLTRYKEKRGIDTVTGDETCYLAAQIKHDVTDQMKAILAAHAKKARRRTARKLRKRA